MHNRQLESGGVFVAKDHQILDPERRFTQDHQPTSQGPPRGERHSRTRTAALQLPHRQ